MSNCTLLETWLSHLAKCHVYVHILYMWRGKCGGERERVKDKWPDQYSCSSDVRSIGRTGAIVNRNQTYSWQETATWQHIDKIWSSYSLSLSLSLFHSLSFSFTRTPLWSPYDLFFSFSFTFTHIDCKHTKGKTGAQWNTICHLASSSSAIDTYRINIQDWPSNGITIMTVKMIETFAHDQNGGIK